MMTLLSTILRIGLAGVCLWVLSRIVPISIAQFETGNSCPKVLTVPACYVVTFGYSAMLLAAAIWWRNLKWVFLAGAVPVFLIAMTGTAVEISGTPICPRSDFGLPLCFVSLAIVLGVSALFLAISVLEARANRGAK